MASETQAKPRLSPVGEAWPPHDNEESVLGTDLHQATIMNLRWGINEAARIGLPDGEPVPWKALSQTALLGCRRPDDSLMRTYPDVFVYPRPIDPTRGSVAVEVDGPPLLVIEVLSSATYEADLDLARGKGYGYAHAGVGEYVALDYTGEFVTELIRAWRLVDGVYRPSPLETDGRWRSAQIDLAIGMEGVWATVFTRDGRRILREGEVEAERARLVGERVEESARLREELTRKDAELDRLRRLLDERGARE